MSQEEARLVGPQTGSPCPALVSRTGQDMLQNISPGQGLETEAGTLDAIMGVLRE